MLIVGLLAVVLGATGCSTLQSSAAPATASDASGQHKPGGSSSMEAKRIALEAATRNTGIAVFRTADKQLQVNLPSEFSFDTDSAAARISVEGRGEHEPSVTKDRPYGRALNRRVEMFLRQPAAQKMDRRIGGSADRWISSQRQRPAAVAAVA